MRIYLKSAEFSPARSLKYGHFSSARPKFGRIETYEILFFLRSRVKFAAWNPPVTAMESFCRESLIRFLMFFTKTPSRSKLKR
ncbi:MAG: hypothetical protein ABIJ27_01035 [Candidatus Omnitrophota bacterium]